MQKIPTVFLRDENDMRRLTHTVHPACQWVIDGEGTATRKYDGTCGMLDERGHWWMRREVKPGKPIPEKFVEVNHDKATGKLMGWVPSDPQGYGHPMIDALDITGVAKDLALSGAPGAFKDVMREASKDLAPGTYELIGPKINGNPENCERHQLIPHKQALVLENDLYKPPYSFEALQHFVLWAVTDLGFEGVVWHHKDGRMAKLKGRDYNPR